MLQGLVFGSATLVVGVTILVVVLLGRRLVLAARNPRPAEARLRPAALAVVYGDDTETPPVAKADAAIFANLLRRFSADLRGGSRARIGQYFERHDYVRAEINRLSSPESWERALAADELGDMASSMAVPALTESLLDPHREVRSAAARSLGRLDAPDAIGPLVAALLEGSVPSGTIGQALITRGPAAIPHLVPLLANPDPSIRAMATELLGLIGGAADADHLMDRLADDSAAVRVNAVRALGRIGGLGSFVSMIGMLADAIPRVRAEAAEALGSIGDERAFVPLLEMARTDAFDPARAAAFALSRIAPARLAEAARQPGAGPYLREATETAELQAEVL